MENSVAEINFYAVAFSKRITVVWCSDYGVHCAETMWTYRLDKLLHNQNYNSIGQFNYIWALLSAVHISPLYLESHFQDFLSWKGCHIGVGFVSEWMVAKENPSTFFLFRFIYLPHLYSNTYHIYILMNGLLWLERNVLMEILEVQSWVDWEYR